MTISDRDSAAGNGAANAAAPAPRVNALAYRYIDELPLTDECRELYELARTLERELATALAAQTDMKESP